MNEPNRQESNEVDQKDFWDGLQSEILNSSHKLAFDNVLSLIEQSFMYSMFFKGCSQTEIIDFQTFLNIKDNGYIILAEFSPLNKSNITDFGIDEITFHQYLKEVLHNFNNAIGSLITNRMLILISDDTRLSDYNTKDNGTKICRIIMNALHKKFKISSSFGIGTSKNINSLYTSFIEALSSLQHCSSNEIIFIQDTLNTNGDHTFDYVETVKHMVEAVRLHKIEAYDYFSMLMDWLKPMNDEAKRNMILETLALASYAMRIDSPSDVCFNYLSHVDELAQSSGEKLIEWAFQSFICITGNAKPLNSIDYSNKIVQTTKEYLETHYAEDICLEDIAEQVNISPQYFSKLIKKTTGFNFIDWLSMLRVKKAKELLTNSNFTVKEVCFMVGYKDPNYFSRIFKKRIGLTPSEYVKNNLY